MHDRPRGLLSTTKPLRISVVFFQVLGSLARFEVSALTPRDRDNLLVGKKLKKLDFIGHSEIPDMSCGDLVKTVRAADQAAEVPVPTATVYTEEEVATAVRAALGRNCQL